MRVAIRENRARDFSGDNPVERYKLAGS